MLAEWLRRLSRGRSAAHEEADLDRLYRDAVAAYQAQSYAESLACAQRLIALDPALPNAHFVVGSALLGLRRYEAAQGAFAKCLTLRPSFPTVLHAELLWAKAQACAEVAAGRTPPTLPVDPASVRPVSIVICSIDAARFAAVSDAYRNAFTGIPHEIIGIHDARSLCEGYNRGAQRANGEIVVFSHDDVQLPAPDFAARLLRHLAQFDLVGIAGTTRLVGPSWDLAGWPHTHGQVGYPGAVRGRVNVRAWRIRGTATPDVQALDGVLLAARRAIVERVAFDERTFDGWHLYDIDFSYSVHRAGYRVAVAHDLCVIHQSGGKVGEEWQRYALRFLNKYGAALPSPPGGVDAAEVWAVEASSADEWRLMTAALVTAQWP